MSDKKGNIKEKLMELLCTTSKERTFFLCGDSLHNEIQSSPDAKIFDVSFDERSGFWKYVKK